MIFSALQLDVNKGLTDIGVWPMGHRENCKSFEFYQKLVNTNAGFFIKNKPIE